MRKFVGFLLVVAGVTLGVIFGLISGIEDFFDGAKATPTNAGQVLWGLVEFFLITPLGGAVGSALAFALNRKERPQNLWR